MVDYDICLVMWLLMFHKTRNVNFIVSLIVYIVIIS
jgi:hypothetical protein